MAELPKCARLSHRDFSSGIRRYFNFCELKEAKPFPTKEETAPERGSISNEWGNYQSYLNCLRMA